MILFWVEIWVKVSSVLCIRLLTRGRKEFMLLKKYPKWPSSPTGWSTNSYSKSKFNSFATIPTFCLYMAFSTTKTMSTFCWNTWKKGHYFCTWRKTQLSIKNKQQPRSSKLHRPFNTCMKTELPIGTWSLKILWCLMESVNYAILDGRPFVIREGKHTVERLTMRPHKFWKESSTTCQWTCGVWAF